MQSNEGMQSNLGEKVNGKPKWPKWAGKTGVLIATGPSLTAEQIDYVHAARMRDECRVVAINEAGVSKYKPLAAPWADVLYAADRDWWTHYKPEFYGLRVSGEAVEGVHTFPLDLSDHQSQAMPREPGKALHGGHSGFQALGMLLTFGVSKVIMLGYDAGGPKRNCHENRDAFFLNPHRKQPSYAAWQQTYNLVPGQWPEVEFYNCSPYSQITAFPKIDLEAVL